MVPTRTSNALFAAIGVVLLLTAQLVKPAYPDAKEILFNVGIVATSVSILDLLWRLAGGNPVEKQIESLSVQVERLSRSVDVIENAKRIGLLSMHDCAGNYGGKAQWLELIASSNQSIDLMGRTLYEWIRAPELDDMIIKKIMNDGVAFRWLLMSSNNQHLPQLEEDGEKIGEAIAKKIAPVCNRLYSIKIKLPIEKQSLLQVRVFDRVPLYCSTIRIDDRYLIIPYLQSVASRNSPLFTLQGQNTPWAIAYDREFNMVWGTASEFIGES